MAASQITWTDKEDLLPLSAELEKNKVTADTMDEIKTKFNTNAGLIDTNTNSIDALEGISGAVPFHYQFESSTAMTSPASGKFRVNNAKPESATQISVHATDSNLDVHDVLDLLSTDHFIYIQDRQDASESVLYKVTTASDNTTYFVFGVTVEDSTTSAFTADNNFQVLPIFPPATGAGTGTVTSVTAGTGLSQTGTSTINPTLLIDYLGTDNFIDSATDLEGTAISSGDTIAYHDATDGNVKKGFVSDLPFALKTASESFIVALSDETTDLTTGTAKASIRMPYAFTLTDVRASVNTAPTGSVLTVDINESVSSVLSTKITIDATEFSSETAATPPVISDSSLADDADISFDIDTVGSTIAGAGLKVTLIGYKT